MLRMIVGGWFITWLVWSCGLETARAHERVAVVVGANASPPGRKPLRFAQEDARAFGQVLVDLGSFAPEAVHVLLDPDPDRVLSELDAALAQLHGESMLVFYYSGHSDAAALYPHGRALAFSSLRQRLSDARSKVRIGIIDACRGGGWTGTKGLTEAEPFEVSLPVALEAEGSVLIASSSGLEEAHEAEQLRGSFFTHHWDAGLRGAADSDADGKVSLTEAFDYAKGLTIRDSALHTQYPQHPSFALNLHGRQELILTQVTRGRALLEVEQQTGPLELVHLDSGVIVLELPEGPRSLRLSVAPGQYLLRRRQGAQTLATTISVRAGDTTHVDEAGLTLQGHSQLVVKAAQPRPLTHTTLPAGTQELSISFGVRHGRPGTGLVLGDERDLQVPLLATHAFTDRFQWIIPALAFAYRFGERGGLEWVPWGGLRGWGIGYSQLEGVLLLAQPTLGLDARAWLTQHSSFDFGLGIGSSLRWAGKAVEFRTDDGQVVRTARFSPPDTWRASASVGYTQTLADSVTLHLALEASVNALHEGKVSTRRTDADVTLAIGSVQTIGLRPVPLVQVHLSDSFALGLDASVQYSFGTRAVSEAYLIGFTKLW